MIGTKAIIKPITVELIVNHESLVMDVNTGAAISEAIFRQVLSSTTPEYC